MSLNCMIWEGEVGCELSQKTCLEEACRYTRERREDMK